MKQYVIIGASAAGMSAATAIRRYDTGAKIIMVSDEIGLPYFRVMLSFVLAGAMDGNRLPLMSEAGFRDLDISMMSGRRAVGVDAGKNQVILDDDTRLDYDALLLATGSRPRSLDVPGGDLKGVHYFRTRRDLDDISACLDDTRQAVVVGGGLVGIKVADALCDRGIPVCMMVTSDKVLSQTADPVTADIVLESLISRGLTVKSGASPVAFQGRGDRVERVVTDTGEEIPCQLVVIGKGVVPNTAPAADLPDLGDHRVNGLPTNGFLATPVDNIFAAGDVAATLDIASGIHETHAIWPVAVEQGRAAGYNMCGSRLSYDGTIHRNAFHIGSRYVITGGMFNPPADDAHAVHTFSDAAGQVHRRLVVRNDRMVGMAFVNDTTSAGIVLSMIQKQQKLSTLPVDVLAPGFDFHRLRR